MILSFAAQIPSVLCRRVLGFKTLPTPGKPVIHMNHQTVSISCRTQMHLVGSKEGAEGRRLAR